MKDKEIKYQFRITQDDELWFGRVVDVNTELSILYQGNEIDAYRDTPNEVLELLLSQLKEANLLNI